MIPYIGRQDFSKKPLVIFSFQNSKTVLIRKKKPQGKKVVNLSRFPKGREKGEDKLLS